MEDMSQVKRRHTDYGNPGHLSTQASNEADNICGIQLATLQRISVRHAQGAG